MKLPSVAILSHSNLFKSQLASIFADLGILSFTEHFSSPEQLQAHMQQHPIDVLLFDTLIVTPAKLASYLKQVGKPAIMLDLHASTPKDICIKFLERGAVDILPLPRSLLSINTYELAELSHLIHTLALQDEQPSLNIERSNIKHLNLAHAAHQQKVILFGGAAGGIEALTKILPQFPKTSPGIVIAQHLQEELVEAFAGRLNQFCAHKICIARHNDEVKPGRIYLAPCGKQNILLDKHHQSIRIKLMSQARDDDPKEPINLLFNSAAQALSRDTIATILSGQCQDGAVGLKTILEHGGITFAQDLITSRVKHLPTLAHQKAQAQTVKLATIPNACMQSIYQNQ